MLEIFWTEYRIPVVDAMNLMAELMAWITGELTKSEYYRSLPFNGFALLKGSGYDLSCIITTAYDQVSKTEIEIMKLLQQPPPRFQDKFIVKQGNVTMEANLKKEPVEQIADAPDPEKKDQSESEILHDEET